MIAAQEVAQSPTSKLFTSNANLVPSFAKMRRLPQLDLLRGLAILLVLLSHPVYVPQNGPLSFVAYECHILGQTGVDLFFVLSGFLVGGLLFAEVSKTGRLRIGNFLIRRGMKIWPGYYAFIFVAFAHRIWHHEVSSVEAAKQMWPLFCNLQNYLGPFDVVTHCWSLAVEEHFYFLLPFIVYLASGLKNGALRLRNITPVLVSIILTLVITRFVIAFVIVHTNMHLKWATHVRADALFFGVLIAYLQFAKPRWYSSLCGRPVFLFLSGVLLVNFRTFVNNEASALIWSLDVLTTYLGHGLCLIALLQVEPGKGCVGKALNSSISKVVGLVGIYSYSIYLWHFEFVGPFVMMRIVRYLPEDLKYLIGMPVYVLGAVLFGFVAAKLIEIPVLRLRERLFPSAI